MSRILIIDDEKVVRYSLRRILESAGFEIAEATNGREGIALQQTSPFDLVLTDIIMPEKEGVETVIELRRDYPDLKIVAMSGGGRTRNLDFLKLAQQFGADRIIAKPFAEDELLSTIQACLDGDEAAIAS